MPGEWPTALRAGEVAVGSSNPWSIAINRELGGNVSRLPNRKYSWTLPTQGTIDSFNWDPFDIPEACQQPQAFLFGYTDGPYTVLRSSFVEH
jgi:hypothetical protein